MITSGLILIVLYLLLLYAFECIKYFNKIDERFGNSLWRWSYDYPVKGKQDISNIDDLKKNESSKQLNKLIDLNKNFNLPLSIANSSGIFLGKQYHLNYVRPGKSLCLLYTSPSPRDRTRSRMPSSA